MKVGIYTNLTRDTEGRATIALIERLKEFKHKILVSDELIPLGLDVVYVDRETLAKGSDVLFVFGGDGTILRIAKECAKYGTKIFAVNLGHMGFMTELENVGLAEAVRQITEGRFELDVRSILQVNFEGKHYLALNEAVLERGQRTKIISGEVRVDGSLLDVYTGDGIIISTPTGTTAYSLSAGGPIVAPEVSAIIICPICPHTLNSRPVVVSDKSVVTLSVAKSTCNARLSIDGEDVCSVPIGETVEIVRAADTISFIRLKKYNFYTKLMQKMGRMTSTNKE